MNHQEYLICFLFILFAGTRVQEAFARVLKTGNCLYIRNRMFVERKFDHATQICCTDSGIHRKYDNLQRLVDCCGERTFIPDKQLCHEKHVYDKESGLGINGEKMICGEEDKRIIYPVINAKESKCCGTQMYSSLTEICCEGLLKSVNEGCKVSLTENITNEEGSSTNNPLFNLHFPGICKMLKALGNCYLFKIFCK